MLAYAATTTRERIDAPRAALFQFFAPCAGTIERVDVYALATSAAASLFNVVVGDALGFDVTLPANAARASLTGLTVPCTAGDLVTIHAAEASAGGVGAPLSIVLTIEDGQGAGGGGVAPANAVTENGEPLTENGQTITEG